jgi:DNA-binding winged helix-turn-helix (wHTH) protein
MRVVRFSAPEVPRVEGPQEIAYQFGPFQLRPDGTLLANGRLVPLTPTEEAVLTVLVEARGLRVGKDRIAERAWPATVPSDASLARCLHTLRRKLREAAPLLPHVIATSYRRGFNVCIPVRRVDAESPADGARQWLNR